MSVAQSVKEKDTVVPSGGKITTALQKLKNSQSSFAAERAGQPELTLSVNWTNSNTRCLPAPTIL
jgi:hypothetical protein